MFHRKKNNIIKNQKEQSLTIETRTPLEQVKIAVQKLSLEELNVIKELTEHRINSLLAMQPIPYNSILSATCNVPVISAEEIKKAKKLLTYVNQAKYMGIERMWLENPLLMFIEVEERPGIFTTPLKRAIYNLDTWAWKPFYEWLKNNKEEWLPVFLDQNASQKNHVDSRLQFLYLEYAKLNEIKINNVKMECDRQLDHHWDAIRKIQRTVLPMHMLREMCRDGWGSYPKFDVQSQPKFKDDRDILYAFSDIGRMNGTYVDIDSDKFVSKDVATLGVMRGDKRYAFATGTIGQSLQQLPGSWFGGPQIPGSYEDRTIYGNMYMSDYVKCAEIDAANLKKLCAARIDDLDIISVPSQRNGRSARPL